MTNLNTYISDLFFNYEKPNYENFKEEYDSQEAKAAMMIDAEDFAVLIRGLGHEVTAQELVEDFYNRA